MVNWKDLLNFNIFNTPKKSNCKQVCIDNAPSQRPLFFFLLVGAITSKKHVAWKGGVSGEMCFRRGATRSEADS